MTVQCWYLFPVSVTTFFTRERIREERIFDERWIVDNPDILATVA